MHKLLNIAFGCLCLCGCENNKAEPITIDERPEIPSAIPQSVTTKELTLEQRAEKAEPITIDEKPEIPSAVPQSVTTKELTLEQRAEQGDAEAQYAVAAKYAEGEGVEQNWEIARSWYHKAAENGSAAAQCALGTLYYNGQGVQVDQQEAFRLFERSASQDCEQAQFNIAIMYGNGEGTPRSTAKALQYLTLAAEKGHLEAQRRLARVYEFGQLDVKKDPHHCFRWTLAAAEQGDQESQLKTGIMFASGSGVAADLSEAVTWLKKAKGNGADLTKDRAQIYSEAIELDNLEGRLISEHIQRYRELQSKIDPAAEIAVSANGRYIVNPGSILANRERDYDRLQQEIIRTRPARQARLGELLQALEALDQALAD